MPQTSKPEGDYTFYKEDRERIKTRSMLPTETLRYIEALEAIAQAGYEVWKETPYLNKVVTERLNALYDVLRVVNFMDKEIPEKDENEHF